MAVGAAFIRAVHARLAGAGEVHFAALRGGGARKSLLILAVMTAHAFGEGAGVGVSFAGQRGWAEGVAVCAAIAVHNIPEGLAVATVLVAAGASARAAAAWAVATHLPQALIAVPAFVFVSTFSRLLPAACGFAAGCMLWMALAELFPDSLDVLPPGDAATIVVAAATLLEAFRLACTWAQYTPGAAGDLTFLIAANVVVLAFIPPISGASLCYSFLLGDTVSATPARRRTLLATSIGGCLMHCTAMCGVWDDAGHVSFNKGSFKSLLAGIVAAVLFRYVFYAAMLKAELPVISRLERGEIESDKHTLLLVSASRATTAPALICIALCFTAASEGAQAAAKVRQLPWSGVAVVHEAPGAVFRGIAAAATALGCDCSTFFAMTAATATGLAHFAAFVGSLVGQPMPFQGSWLGVCSPLFSVRIWLLR